MSEQRDAPSVLGAAVARLREEIIARSEPGAFLGSEEELQIRLGVSRPTLRQAARLLEHENLLTVRRGARGGLFTRSPSPAGVSHVASVYLRYQGTDHRDLHRADSLLIPAIARLAAAHPDVDARAALADFATSPEHLENVAAPALVRQAWREFGLRLIALVDSPPLALFYEILLDLSVEPFPLHGVEEVRLRRRIIRFHAELSDAVRIGSPDESARIASEYLAETGSWIG